MIEIESKEKEPSALSQRFKFPPDDSAPPIRWCVSFPDRLISSQTHSLVADPFRRCKTPA